MTKCKTGLHRGKVFAQAQNVLSFVFPGLDLMTFCSNNAILRKGTTAADLGDLGVEFWHILFLLSLPKPTKSIAKSHHDPHDHHSPVLQYLELEGCYTLPSGSHSPPYHWDLRISKVPQPPKGHHLSPLAPRCQTTHLVCP